MKKRELIYHSLQKWKGLLEKNLDKHGVSLVHGPCYSCVSDTDNWESLVINAESCSLCREFAKISYDNFNCRNCPFVTVLGGRCDDSRDYYLFQEVYAEAKLPDKFYAPWHIFQNEHDPRYMVAVLEHLLWNCEDGP
jgi:hypothetical protein